MEYDSSHGDDGPYYGSYGDHGTASSMGYDTMGNVNSSMAFYGNDANRQMVAQRYSGSTLDPPLWDGTPATFDLFSKKTLDWTLSTKTASHKQGYAVLHRSVPVKPRERLRATLNDERLTASNWRSSVSSVHHALWQDVNVYTPQMAKYRDISAEIKAQRSFQKQTLAVQAGVEVTKVDDVIVENAVRQAMGDRYVKLPAQPDAAVTDPIAEGDHDIHGAAGDVHFGEKMSCGVRYLLELLEETQLVKPIHRYMTRLKRFLNCRRPHKGSITAYINEYLTLKAELLSDKSIKGFDIPDKLSAMLLLTFANITDNEYTIVMSHVDGVANLDNITEDKIQSVLTNILGDRDTQKSKAYYVGEADGRPYEESCSEAYFSPEDDGYSWQDTSEEWSFWSDVLDHVKKDNDPPLLPNEDRQFVDEENCRWTWEGDSNTYFCDEYDQEAKCYKAKPAGKGKRSKRMRRRFPKKGKSGRARGMQAVAEEAQSMCDWYEEAYFGEKGSGKGWFGTYLPREDFMRRLRAKGGGKGKGKGFSSGKTFGGGKGKSFGKRAPMRPNSGVRSSFFCHAFTCESSSNGVGRDKSGARPARRGNRHKKQNQHQSLGGWVVPTHRRQESAHIADGYAVMDPGCTKAVTSEFYKRKLVAKLKQAGFEDGVVDMRPSTTAYSFADGEGKTSKSGYQADLLHVLGGKEMQSEWEVLPKGKTPPLFSLEQHENLYLDISYRPDSAGGSRMSSSLLGWKDRPILKDGGHHVINLVECSRPGVSALLAQGCVPENSNISPEHGPPTADPGEKVTLGCDEDSVTNAGVALAEADSVIGQSDSEDSDSGGEDPKVFLATAKQVIQLLPDGCTWDDSDLTQFCLATKDSRDHEDVEDHLKNNVNKKTKGQSVSEEPTRFGSNTIDNVGNPVFSEDKVLAELEKKTKIWKS